MRSNHYTSRNTSNYYHAHQISNRRVPTKKRTILPVEFRISLFMILFTVIMILFGNLYNIVAHDTTIEDSTEKFYACIEVVDGDTLDELALEYQPDLNTCEHASLVDEICYINQLKDSNTIFIGQKLMIPYYK